VTPAVGLPGVADRPPQVCLCGDTKQLGPNIVSDEARANELDTSMLERLFRCVPGDSLLICSPKGAHIQPSGLCGSPRYQGEPARTAPGQVSVRAAGATAPSHAIAGAGRSGTTKVVGISRLSSSCVTTGAPV
jgi:hypothetical protein